MDWLLPLINRKINKSWLFKNRRPVYYDKYYNNVIFSYIFFIISFNNPFSLFTFFYQPFFYLFFIFHFLSSSSFPLFLYFPLSLIRSWSLPDKSEARVDHKAQSIISTDSLSVSSIYLALASFVVTWGGGGGLLFQRFSLKIRSLLSVLIVNSTFGLMVVWAFKLVVSSLTLFGTRCLVPTRSKYLSFLPLFFSFSFATERRERHKTSTDTYSSSFPNTFRGKNDP